MSRIHERAQQMSQEMQRWMEQNQSRITERDRMMLRSCEQVGEAAQQMQQLGLRAREMQQDRDMIRDRDMQRDMDRLHQHLRTMATEMEGTLQTMERMRQRIHKPAP